MILYIGLPRIIRIVITFRIQAISIWRDIEGSSVVNSYTIAQKRQEMFKYRFFEHKAAFFLIV